MKTNYACRNGAFLPNTPVNLVLFFGHVETALIYQNICWLTDTGWGSRKIGEDYWLDFSQEKMRQIWFPWLSKPTFSKLISKLEDMGAIISIQPNGSVDRRKCFRIAEGFAEKMNSQDSPLSITGGRFVDLETSKIAKFNLPEDSQILSSSCLNILREDTNPSGSGQPSQNETSAELDNVSQHASGKPKQGMENLPETQPFPAMGLEGMTQAPRSHSKPEPESFPSQPPKTPEKAKRNQLLEHLAGIDGSTLEKVTPAGWKVAAKALKEIKAVEGDALTTDMLTRAENAYRKRFPDCRCTPLALAKHWGSLFSSQAKTATASPYRLVTQEDIDSGAFPDQSRPF